MVDYNKPTTPEDILRRAASTGSSSSTYLKKLISANTEAIANTDAYILEFTSSVVDSLENIQNQIDGVITTYFESGVPTLENYPTNEWPKSEYANHLGDLYYDKDTGYAYRFSLNSDGTYSWYQLVDSDVTEALAIANAAQDTADNKRRVFVDTPYIPYDVGDLWIDSDTTLYRCSVARSAGNFSSTDWVVATDYTNDDYAKNVEAVLDSFKEVVATDYVSNSTFTTSVDSINANVTSITTITEEITTNIESISGELSDTNSDIENLSEILTTTQTEITEITNSVSEIITNSYTKTEVQEAITNGTVSSLENLSVTIDIDGMTIDSDNSKTKTVQTPDEFAIIDKTGSTETTVFSARYDEDLGETIVEADNLTVDRYINLMGVARIEKYTDDSGNVGVGLFLT